MTHAERNYELMFKNNKYNFTAFLLWSAYFCHGIQALLISQNAKFFAVKWNLISQANLTDPAKLAVATGTVLAAVASQDLYQIKLVGNH